MAMWSLLGARGVDVLGWEAFGRLWVADAVNQLPLENVTTHIADYGHLPDLWLSISTMMSFSPGMALPPGFVSPMATGSRTTAPV